MWGGGALNSLDYVHSRKLHPAYLYTSHPSFEARGYTARYINSSSSVRLLGFLVDNPHSRGTYGETEASIHLLDYEHKWLCQQAA